jgi:hypothetical protein
MSWKCHHLIVLLLKIRQAESGDIHIGMGSKGITLSNDGDLHGIGHGGVGGEVRFEFPNILNSC